jgi:histone methylation protein DOT1
MSMAENPTASVPRTVRDWWKRSVREYGWIATLASFSRECRNFLRDSTPEAQRRRYGDVEYDWEHRVDTTSATVGWRDRLLGHFHSPYQPTEAELFHQMLSALDINFVDFTFIDLGSGKGRTLMMASDYPFRRIFGVELLPNLDRIAQENLRRYKSESQKCFRLEATCGDAQAFEFPAEPLLLYLFNPLPPAGLARVIRNLERSLQEHSRPVFVLYHNPEHEEILAQCSSLRRTAGTHQYSIFSR